MSEEKKILSNDNLNKVSDEELGEVSGGMKIVVTKYLFGRRSKCPNCGKEMAHFVLLFHQLSCHE